MSSLADREAAVNAAVSLAEDISSGQLDPADLDRQLVAELTALVGTVVGPDDPLFDLQVKICRGVLAVSGIPATEVAEWAAVARLAQQGPEPDAEAADPAEVDTTDADPSADPAGSAG